MCGVKVGRAGAVPTTREANAGGSAHPQLLPLVINGGSWAPVLRRRRLSLIRATRRAAEEMSQAMPRHVRGRA